MVWTENLKKNARKPPGDDEKLNDISERSFSSSNCFSSSDITRPKYRRDGLRYASDITDSEWAVIAPPLLPPATCGRSRKASRREAINGVFCMAQAGCQWRMLPKDFPPSTTVQR